MKKYVLMSWVSYIGLMAAFALLHNLWLFFSGMAILGVMLIYLLLKLRKNYVND